MFYSQFILAKKGPLGTIWIAAHLERKLRKNQVADTDIGVSVDSILSPEVPIALRLSSHLLLGVVRIYNRKVNYLFDDCSEALLKIKQAFRSTAVDLPPEESTAPYHSITLPETFDLDDFELPDNDILQGNYVDHHISSREQITLQDTMEGVVCSTSQFGLDERFGDGDTSQVGLELEEDLFLNNAAASVTNEVSEVDPGMLIDVMEDPERDVMDSRAVGSSASVPVSGSVNKIGGLSPNVELAEYAQAPSTPVLVEELNFSSVQHGLVCDDHLESEDRNSADIHGAESTEHVYSKSDRHRDGAIDSSLSDRVQCQETEQDVCLLSDLTINHAILEGAVYSTPISIEELQEGGTTSGLQGVNKVEEHNDGVLEGDEPVPQPMELMDRKCEESSGAGLPEAGHVDASRDVEGQLLDKMVALDTACGTEAHSAPEHVSSAIHHLQGEDSLGNNIDDRQMTSSTSMFGLQACNSSLNDSVLPSDIQPVPLLDLSKTPDDTYSYGTSTNVQGEECHLGDSRLVNSAQVPQTDHEGKILDGGYRPEDELNNEIPNNDHSENVAEFPVPEKLLSVPDKDLDRPDELIGAPTPVSELLGINNRNGSGNKVSRKKRSFTESSLNMPSGNSVESCGLSRLRRTSGSESVPDDDDLLSSILVERKSSVLRLKPTPPGLGMPTAKRLRPTSRPSAFKRKVVTDETMVLQGDTIRQQLTNTEDIRRLRKKAPCTRFEILMIQRQVLEDEVFTAPVLTGMLPQLMHLHDETLDFSGIRIAKSEVFSDMAVGVECSARLVNRCGELDEISEPVDCREIDGEQPIEPPVLSEDKQDGNHCISVCGVSNEGLQDAIGIVADLEILGHESFEGKLDRGSDNENAEKTDAPNGFETFHMEHAPPDIPDQPAMLSVETSPFGKGSDEDASQETNTGNQLSDKIFTLPTEETCLEDVHGGEVPDGVEMVGHFRDGLVATRSELVLEVELLMNECQDGPAIKVQGDQADGNDPCAKPDTLPTIGCLGTTLANEEQAPELVGNGKVGLAGEDECHVTGLEHNIKDKSCMHSEELKVSPSHSGACEDVKNSYLNDGIGVVSQDVNCQTIGNAEVNSLDRLSIEDQCDLSYLTLTNDTEFLNVDDDDDEMGEEDDNDMPSVEDCRLLDNSGWSSRTRAVAKYLRTLFDGEAGQGRNVVSMEHLLAGKTRKEASRMFFETLVLKTRDYIHVEQRKPYDDINIKLSVKLMKSDFE